MIQEEIIKGNKLIAEFLGGKFYKDTPMILEVTVNSPSGNSIMCIDKLKYHSSWDWLMPVVDKICNIDSGYDFNTHSSKNFFIVAIYCPEKEFQVCQYREYRNQTTLIKLVWLAVLDFITWYNQSQHNSNL